MIKKQDIRALTKEQLRSFFTDNGDKAFRGNQVYEWLWSKVAYSFDDMTNLSKKTRIMLDQNFVINHIEVDQMQRSNDGTIKNAIKLHDGMIVESKGQYRHLMSHGCRPIIAHVFNYHPTWCDDMLQTKMNLPSLVNDPG